MLLVQAVVGVCVYNCLGLDAPGTFPSRLVGFWLAREQVTWPRIGLIARQTFECSQATQQSKACWRRAGSVNTQADALVMTHIELDLHFSIIVWADHLSFKVVCWVLPHYLGDRWCSPEGPLEAG
jgi:hypothetical protein